MTTGCHSGRQYADHPEMLAAATADLTSRFIRDLVDGLPGDDLTDPPDAEPARGPGGKPVMAGLIKAAVGYWSIPPFERRVLEAAGAAHAATGAPVMVHLEHGSAAFEVLALLRDAGVASHRVVLAHVDRNPDAGLHAEIAAAGAYLGYDGMARHREWPDSVLIETMLRVAALGGADRIVLGGDVARRSRFIAYGGIPGMAYLPERFVPRLRREAGDDLVDGFLVRNPARLLAWSL
jgi:5-phospho-D-xylono-1,4-lactonase